MIEYKIIYSMIPKEVIDILKGYFNENKKLVIGVIGTSIVDYLIDSVVVPRIMAKLFTEVNDVEKLKKNLYKLIASWSITQFGHALSTTLYRKLEPSMTQYITMELTKAVFNKYEKDHEKLSATVIVEKINIIKNNIQDVIYMLTVVFIPHIIVLIVTTFSFMQINLKLGICVLVCLLVDAFMIFNNVDECIHKAITEIHNKDAFYNYMEDIITNLSTIASTPNGYNYELKRTFQTSSNTRTAQTESTGCVNNRQNKGYAMNIVLFSGISYYIYRLYKNKELTGEQVLTSLLSMKALFANVYDMTYYVPDFIRKLGILKSNGNFLKQLMSNRPTGKQDNPFGSGTIEVKDLSFAYKEDTPLFEDLSLIIPDQSIIAFVGHSGSGKSSFVNLLLGVNVADKGVVEIGGVDISTITLSSLRSQISYVAQNTTNLFTMTVYENIIYGYQDSEPLRNKVKEIMTTFSLHNIYRSMVVNQQDEWSFLDMPVGRLGELLSGGQKQVIHLIRAVLHENTKIVILDEPTSAIDPTNRQNIFRLIEKLNMDGKTIIMITHDNELKDKCQYVLTFESGKQPVLSSNT